MLRKITLGFLFALTPAWAGATIRIVTTTQDLASLAAEVAGNLASVESIAKGYQDPHFVEAKPSYLLKLKKADLFIQVGLELEVGWAPPLLMSARNPRILPGNDGFLDASLGCEVLQIPTGRVDRSLGDVHPLGNPHYWLDSSNGRVIAKNIAKKLALLDPPHAGDFEKNLADFESRLRRKENEWVILAAPLKGVKIVTYHDSWPYFAKQFNLDVRNFIEPKPGIPPSPAHIRALGEQIKAEKIPLLLVEPYFDLKLPEKIAAQTGASLLVLSPSVGTEPHIQSYLELFDHNLRLLIDILNRKG